MVCSTMTQRRQHELNVLVFVFTEIASLEKQLAAMKEALAKQKRATHMWKNRFEQERRARYAF